MGRPKKEKIKYFSFDTDFYQDQKIRIIMEKLGAASMTVYSYILCMTYGGNQYYLVLDEPFYETACKDLGVEKEYIEKFIKYAKDLEVFDVIQADKTPFSFPVLTSKSIQRQYQEAKSSLRRCVSVDSTIWVLDKESTSKYIAIDGEVVSEKESKEEIKKPKKTAKKKATSENSEYGMASIEGTYYVPQVLVDKLKETYPLIDIEQRLKEMSLWCISHKLKHDYQIDKFVCGWIKRENDGLLEKAKQQNSTPEEIVKEQKTEYYQPEPKPQLTYKPKKTVRGILDSLKNNPVEEACYVDITNHTKLEEHL